VLRFRITLTCSGAFGNPSPPQGERVGVRGPEHAGIEGLVTLTRTLSEGEGSSY